MATADDKPEEVLAWLDGLAGRAAPSAVAHGRVDDTAHADGARLRAALLNDADGHRGAEVSSPAASTDGTGADWQHLLQRAQPTQAANEPLGGDAVETMTPETPGGVAAAVNQAAPTAAKNARPWGGRAWAAAAAVAALALLLNLVPRGNDDATGPPAMRGSGGSAAATWLSSNPAQDVEQLLGALNAAGAQTTVQTTAAGLELRIQAAPAAREAVNTLLSRLDTALDSDGGLTLRVVPTASAPR